MSYFPSGAALTVAIAIALPAAAQTGPSYTAAATPPPSAGVAAVAGNHDTAAGSRRHRVAHRTFDQRYARPMPHRHTQRWWSSDEYRGWDSSDRNAAELNRLELSRIYGAPLPYAPPPYWHY